jgi:type I restriction enzyme M protein
MLSPKFSVVDETEIEENEFNLNLPRYVDTFEPEKVVLLNEAVANLRAAENAGKETKKKLDEFLKSLVI